jgi:hypothetical protein
MLKDIVNTVESKIKQEGKKRTDFHGLREIL